VLPAANVSVELDSLPIEDSAHLPGLSVILEDELVDAEDVFWRGRRRWDQVSRLRYRPLSPLDAFPEDTIFTFHLVFRKTVCDPSRNRAQSASKGLSGTPTTLLRARLAFVTSILLPIALQRSIFFYRNVVAPL
jgi:hypothetical protein